MMIRFPKLMHAIDHTNESISYLEQFEHIPGPLLDEFKTFFSIVDPTNDYVYKEGDWYVERWRTFLTAFRRQAVITLQFRAAYKHEDRLDVIEFLKVLSRDNDEVVRKRAGEAIKYIEDAIKYDR